MGDEILKDGREILDKIDMFISETTYANDYPEHPEKYRGMRPIQFMRWWRNFRPGDRVDAMFGEDFIDFAGTNAEGYFAGVKKKDFLGDPLEIAEFKRSEGNIWNFV